MAASRQNNESYGPKTDEMAVFGPFFVYDSGKEGGMWAGERESRAAGKEGRKDGKDGWK